ncbi:MAG TPA: heme NO-binding domain-containing protein [Gaiellaceae bacterium]|jgi:hypothetical protein|nr:heme NO-binding domain-containing protein [Gaiellaceae bacterium]
MHGLIFTSFRAFVASEYPAVSDEVWANERHFVTESYSDEEFDTIVARTADLSGDPRATVLRRFGIFAGVSTFRLLYPDYYAEHRDTFSFLLDIEQRIHQVVRNTVPLAAPPHLAVRALSGGGVSIAYTSSRALCQLLEGLVVGVARFYGETVLIEQPLCMHRGDAAGCTFFVTPMPAARL